MTIDLDDLRSELDELAEPKKEKKRSAVEERVLAGFEEILKFVQDNGREPANAEGNDIFERLYAVRLEQLRKQTQFHELLSELDTEGLLGACDKDDALPELGDDELLAELAASEASTDESDITNLTHVRSHKERQAAKEVANRVRCNDFEQFKDLFEQVQREIKEGVRLTAEYGKNAAVEQGDFYILGGVLTYVAEIGEEIKATDGRPDARLRVIFANGTESNMLGISLKRALYKNEASRRVGPPEYKPLLSDQAEEGDIESGTIYVLRSKSNEPFVAENRELIHKIGVTGGSVEKRIANAANEATYLLADVEVVATYRLVGINRNKVENLIHRGLGAAQIDLVIKDRFGKPVKPREWFLVPIHTIDAIVKKLMNGTLTDYIYDPSEAKLRKIQ
jgi:hypothetical protein